MGFALVGCPQPSGRVCEQVDLPGPSMVTIPVPPGTCPLAPCAPESVTKYCIDRTEVTQSQYAKFLAAAVSPVFQGGECVLNQTFVPSADTGGCTPSSFDASANPDHPVVCVDWCDASKYCEWAGKRLCGGIGGIQVGGYQDSAKVSQWFNACSGSGTRFPYGPDYEPETCNGADYAAGSTIPVGGAEACAGVGPPFNAVYDMSGNVREWTDECIAVGPALCANVN